MVGPAVDWKVSICISLALMVTFSVSKVHAQEKLVFGVRVDAPPFSYHEAVSEYLSDSSMPGAPRAHGFKGYMVDVCSSVIEALQNEGRIDTPVSTRVVNAGNRFDLLRDGEVHILCDPATILQERLKIPPQNITGKARYLNVSVPVYMSSVTVARPMEMPAGASPCRVLVGSVGETTAAPNGINRIVQDRSFRRWGTEILAAVKAINSGEPSPTIPGKANDEACPEFPVIKHYATHRELARAFCDNDVLYYVGDVEIVRAMLQREKCIDSSIIAPATFTVERYGIYTALPQREVLTAAILVFLSELSLQIHGGYIGDEKSRAVVKESPSALLDIVYEQTFEGYSPSRNLLDFFWNITGSYPHAN